MLGIDLGATKAVAVLLSTHGTVLRTSGRFAHSNDGPDGVVDVLVQAVKACLGSRPVPARAVGVAVAAQVDPGRGWVVHAPNLGWRNVPLGPNLARRLGRPVHIVNDARAATYAEWRFGAGRGCSDLFGLMAGTGIGGSAVVGGRLLEGSSHAAGEVGHLPIVSGGRKCHCPGRGCLEAYAGGWAIAQRAQEAVRKEPRAGRGLIERAGTRTAITAETVFAAARAGDRLARRLTAETETYLADGAVGVVNAFNPAILVLAGGLITGRPELVQVVAHAVRTRSQPPAAGVRVRRAILGDLAPAVGAAGLALEARSPGRRAPVATR